MKIPGRPMLITILFGLACGVSLVPVTVALSFVFAWSTAFRMTLWAYLASYGFLLTKWGNVRFTSIVFPLVIVFPFSVWGNSATPFLLLALGVFSWVRSGICFQGPLPKMLGIEFLISIGAGALVACFAPCSPAMWAMGVWMFFLVQSLYFLFVRVVADQPEPASVDPFEDARRRAEEVLSAVPSP